MLKKCYRALRNNFLNKTNWLSFILGLSLVFAYAPFSQWWLTLIIPALWFSIIDKANSKQASKQGFIFGLAWFASGISWVHVSMDQFGGLPLAVSLLLMLLLCLYLALFPALACFLTSYFSQKKQLSLWLLPAFWAISEYCREVFLTGFPWLSLGYSQIDSPLAVFAPIIGETGLTLVVLIINILVFKLISSAQGYFKETPNTQRSTITLNASLLFTLIILTFALHHVNWVVPTGKTFKTALVQANIKQELKWLPEQEWPTMLKFLDLTRKNYDADLIVWPESAVPSFEPAVQDYLESVNKSASLNNSAIITGILNYNFETKKYFNSLIVLGNKHKTDNSGSYYYGHSNRYNKHHLLPIGEFVPFGDLLRPLAPFFNLPQSSFSRGDYQQDNLIANDIHILPLICFEIAFPKQLAANFTDKTQVILTVSNDAWFGNSHGPHQHQDIARMRALEFGRPLIRSTNTGITATIDHLGKITAIIPQFEEAVLTTTMQLVEGHTPYSRWGWLTIWLLPLLMLLIHFLLNKKFSQ
jgi:apolipoprotein N-acyltransferase